MYSVMSRRNAVALLAFISVGFKRDLRRRGGEAGRKKGSKRDERRDEQRGQCVLLVGCGYGAPACHARQTPASSWSPVHEAPARLFRPHLLASRPGMVARSPFPPLKQHMLVCEATKANRLASRHVSRFNLEDFSPRKGWRSHKGKHRSQYTDRTKYLGFWSGEISHPREACRLPAPAARPPREK